MIKLVDLNYYTHDTHDLRPAVNVFATSYEYVKRLSPKASITVVKHLQSETSYQSEGVIYTGFKGINKFYFVPFKTHAYINSINPDVVLVQGLIFPFQILLLRLILGNKVKIIAQHHGDRPFENIIKRYLQKLADKYIAGYLFTSLGNAKLWVEKGVISTLDKCYEILEASTFLSIQDKQFSRNKLRLSEGDIFLWVGRLNNDKDPMTVLRGFEKYLNVEPLAKLYFIFQGADLLEDIKVYINASALLQSNVILVGETPNDELAYWFSAADYFVSGSHREGSGYALIECMACGCIPIVSDIPPFRTITDNGKLGLLFKVGDVNGFADKLLQANKLNKVMLREQILNHFANKLSFDAIAGDVYNVCKKVLNK